MPKKISLEEKMKWLGDYENGKSEARIAKDEHHHLRIVRKGIEEARRTRDIRIANVGIMKDALRDHQSSLQEELMNVRRIIEVPPYDYAPLSWHYSDHSVFSTKTVNTQTKHTLFTPWKLKQQKQTSTILDLLKQHLWYDETKLWPKLTQWENTYSEYLKHREVLQLKTVDILKTRTGYPVISEKHQISPPYVYAHVAGDCFYKAALGSKFNSGGSGFDSNEFIADSSRGVVTYRHSTLAEAPGNETQTRLNLIAAYDDIIVSTELTNVVLSTRKLTEVVEMIKSKIDNILLINYIPGRCDVCRRLGL